MQDFKTSIGYNKLFNMEPKGQKRWTNTFLFGFLWCQDSLYWQETDIYRSFN